MLAAGCGADGSRPPEPAAAEEGAGEAIFVDVTAEAGLDFRHENGMSGEFYFVEMVGGGAALFDYDGDGDLDLYLVQSGVFDPPRDGGPATVAYREDLRDRLYRNDLDAPGALPRLVDVTQESGIAAYGYGMGVAAGDFDGDGWIDLYVTNFGPNQLWRNRGPGADGKVTFEDVTAAAGADDRRWSTSAAFLDYDRDGRLDLYVVNYVDYDLGDRRRCASESGRRDYCGPQNYSGEPDRLLRNRGPGRGGVPTFEDVSGPAGILSEYGSGLGVVTADFDLDGFVDVYVANDLMANVLWRHRGDGTFADEALYAGCAVNMEGAAEASMGVDAGDFDNDGDEDLFVTHLAGETNTLYLNDGAGIFEDQSRAAGLGAVSLPYTGFGTAVLDFDSDGWLDLVAVNGAVHVIEARARAGDPYPFDQPNQLYRNAGPRNAGPRNAGPRNAGPRNAGPAPAGVVFEDVTAAAGEAFAASEVSRGTAVGDVDNDGDADLVIGNNRGPARLLLNQGAATDRHWLGLRLVGRDGRRDQLGARVEVAVGDGRTLYRRARADASYCSANDPRVLVGLGEAAPAAVEAVRVAWPDGGCEEFATVPTGVYSTLRRGAGRALECRGR